MIEKNNLIITIAIPSYKRPYSLIKAIKCLESQTYKNFIILISINGNEKENIKYKKIESEYNHKLNIKYYFQNKNIGTLNNYFYLLNKVKTKYFMWLADDDIISPSCLEDLISLLLNNNKAVTAVPIWELVNKDLKKKILTPSHFHQENSLKRILSFCNNSDDAFFYGLHKTENIKKCSFNGFWKPNSKSISNWCYIYLFDLVIQGKILFNPNAKAKWTNYDFGIKYYKKSSTNKKISLFQNSIKKINIYCIYLIKIIKWKKYHFLPLAIPLLIFFLIRDLLIGQKIYRNITFK